MRCGTGAARGVYRGCAGCGRGQARVLRVDANPVFYPQYVTVVNPPTRADYAMLDTDEVYPAAVAQALGSVPPGLDGLRGAVNDAGTGEAEQRARQQLMQEFGFVEGDPMLEELLTRRRQKRPEAEDWTAVVASLNLDQESLTELGHQCLELLLAREASPITIETLAAQAPNAALRALYETRYLEVLRRYGFVEALMLRKFPLAFVVAGYTREEQTPSPGVQFNFFRGPTANFPMYGQRMETEGLLFRLDPARVVSWLVASGVVDDPGAVDPLRWLFGVMRPVRSIFDAPDDRITRAVLGLVHSISHRTLKAVSVRSGLAPESLSEYLMPHNLAFIVYADTRSEFVLGGLEHVFRNSLAESLEALEENRRCVFDPPCNAHHGACAFCMFLSETSCERFNSALSRHYLFGGEDEATQWQGFWNP